MSASTCPRSESPGPGAWARAAGDCGAAGGACAPRLGPREGASGFTALWALGRARAADPAEAGGTEAGGSARARRGYTVSGPLGPGPGPGSHQGAEPRPRRDPAGPGAQCTRAALWGAVSRGESNVGRGLGEPGF